MSNNLIRKVKKFGRLFERKFLFYFLQIFILLIAFTVIKNNFLVSQDMNIRGSFNDIRYSEGTSLYNKINYTPIKEESYLDKIVLVGIDQKFFQKESISLQGLHRGYYAQALKNIKKANPSAIGIDVFFEQPYHYEENDKYSKTLNRIFKAYDKQLASELNKDTVIAGAYDFYREKILKPDELFLKNGAQVGHIHSNEIENINLGIYPPLHSKINPKEKINPLSMEIYGNRATSKNKKLNNFQKSFLIEEKEKFVNIKGTQRGGLSIPKSGLGDNKLITTPIYLPKKTDFNYISFYDIYKDNFNKELLEDKIIMIGATDPTLQDVKLTLKGNIPGVIVHANSLLSLMVEDFIYILDTNETFIFIFSIILLNMLLIFIFKNSRGITSIFYLLITEILVVIFISTLFSFGSIGEYSIYLPLATLIFLITLQLIINLIYAIIETSSVKENFQKLFNLYVGEKLSKKTQKDIDEIGEKIAEEKDIAIFFSDIAGFTELSEKLTPSQNVFFLNEYLEQMSAEISKYNGFIDKYVGDAIMAFWEEEGGCELAANSAIGNIIALEQVNQNINAELEENITLKCRIGLNFGKAIVGDIGSEKHKLNYTSIGDNVNLAARLEGINKFYGTQICLSEYFYEQIKDNTEFVARKLDRIRVKGKKDALEIYHLYPTFRGALTQTQKKEYDEFIELFENGLEEYFVGNFSKAIESFEKALLIQKDYATQIFIERCQELLKNPVENWDGIREFKEK